MLNSKKNFGIPVRIIDIIKEADPRLYMSSNPEGKILNTFNMKPGCEMNVYCSRIMFLMV